MHFLPAGLCTRPDPVSIELNEQPRAEEPELDALFVIWIYESAGQVKRPECKGQEED